MLQIKELSAHQLRFVCDPDDLNFKTTKDIGPGDNIIGQERAIKAMDFGIRVKRDGYNIFISGPPGTGKTSYARAAITKFAENEPAPDDWLYVYNFEDTGKPLALNLPAGWGSGLKGDMQELVNELREIIPKAFSSDEYEKQKATHIKSFQETRAVLLEELTQKAEEEGFALKKTSGGFVTVPVIDKKEIGEDDYNNLEADLRDDLEKKSTEIQLKAMDIMRRIQKVEREFKAKVKEMDTKVALLNTGHLFNNLKEKYADHEKVVYYITLVQKNVLDNLNEFRSEDEEEQSSLPWLRRQNREQFSKRYQVNLIIDNKETKGVPVVFETNPMYYNLIGRMEYENRFGMLATDFTMIAPGALHRANGGYLVLQTHDLFRNLHAWNALKQVLKTKEIRIENIGEQLGLIAMASLKAEPIPLNVKIILIGSPIYYHLLHNYDEDFRKLFKIKVDFSTEMKRNKENIEQIVAFISTICNQNELHHFDKAAVAGVIEHCSRLAGHQEELSVCFNEILEIIYEADAWVRMDGGESVTREYIKRAIEEKIKRSNKYEDRLKEMIYRGQLLIDVDGEAVGQVNGLAVVDLGDYRFGRSFRITASSFVGRHGITNIERESKMSGRLHDKGVLILSAYLGEKYAQEIPLTLSASICFEQQYQGVDGDSASSAELCALLSALSGLPAKQELAITGSVNQKGYIQPVGGVTEKIEGFFSICKIKGLTGKQGVIIPSSNVQNLTLSEDVVSAVDSREFHIYPVKTIDEAVEVMFGVCPSTMDCRIMETLERYNTLAGGRDDHDDDEVGTDVGKDIIPGSDNDGRGAL